MEKTVLLLNADYSPLKIIPWHRAIVMYFDNKVNIIESYEDYPIKSVNFTMKCPAVVVLRKYAKISDRRVTFSRTNVFSRDYYTCQYCGIQPGMNGLTFDHVLPRSRGGKTEWENIITSCYSCNSKKADRTPEEARMKIRKNPIKPETFAQLARTFRVNNMPLEWDSYLPN